MEKIKIPKDMDDAKALGTVLSKYKDTYYSQVLVAYFATYVLYPLRKYMHHVATIDYLLSFMTGFFQLRMFALLPWTNSGHVATIQSVR